MCVRWADGEVALGPMLVFIGVVLNRIRLEARGILAEEVEGKVEAALVF